MDLKENIQISVVVCTYNRLEMLKKCLESLREQSYKNFEVIVVNDASSDGTKVFLDSIQTLDLTALHHEDNSGLSPSRNDGIKKARYGLIAFTDDDCIADKDWLLEIKKAFEIGDADFGSGQTFLVSKDHQGSFPERIVTNINAKWPKGNNLIIKKAVFEKAGLFDRTMDYYCNDDSEFGIRVISLGFKFISIPSAVVYHQLTYWTSESLLRSARNPSVWVLLKKKYPGHYMHFNPPIKKGWIINGEDYLHIFAMALVLPILLIRYIIKGQRDFKLFFTKWPLYPFLRRWYIYKTAIKQKKFMV